MDLNIIRLKLAESSVKSKKVQSAIALLRSVLIFIFFQGDTSILEIRAFWIRRGI